MLLGLMLIGCDGFDDIKCLESVKQEFPEAMTIHMKPKNRFTFIVVDKDSSVYYVRTGNQQDAEVTSVRRLRKLVK